MDAVKIEWLQPDGAGAGRGPEGLVRVRGAVPGDVVLPRVVQRKGRSVDAEIDQLQTASPHRRTPPCPFDAACGGCDLSALQPEPRRAALAAMVAHTLGLDATPVVVPSPRATGHRARIKLAVDDNGRVGYRRRRSHDLVPVDHCLVARPEVDEALSTLRAIDPGVLARAESVELRSNGNRVVFAFEGRGKPPTGEAAAALRSLVDVAWNGRPLAGDPVLELTVLGHRLRVSPRAFYQVNLEANALLVQHVVDVVVSRRPEALLDLYAGNGNLTLPLVQATGVGAHAVELEGSSLSDLRVNADRANLPITAHPGKVERYDPATAPFDVAVLDPPRAGAKGVLPRVLSLRPRAVVYVSCNVNSLRRDLKEIRGRGYALADVRCFDMFPDTHHVETVAVLDRQ